MDPRLGRPHTSNAPNRGYVEYDPHVSLPTGETLHGGHGVMDIPAEVAREAYGAKMLDNSVIQQIVVPKNL